MGWLAIITQLLPLILKILELFQDEDVSDLNPRQAKKVGQLYTACKKFVELADAKGVKGKALPASSGLDD